jgi:diacylglycerol kinase family enzyme
VRVTREHPAPVQVDGELLAPSREVHIEVLKEHLTVLIPRNDMSARR